VLAQHPDVRDAAVLLVNHRNGQNDILTLAQQLAHLDRETSLNLLSEVATSF
jgi:hypothetical protein